jgi:hypothetical protein
MINEVFALAMTGSAHGSGKGFRDSQFVVAMRGQS